MNANRNSRHRFADPYEFADTHPDEIVFTWDPDGDLQVIDPLPSAVTTPTSTTTSENEPDAALSILAYVCRDPERMKELEELRRRIIARRQQR
jgi:hypothetical protein